MHEREPISEMRRLPITGTPRHLRTLGLTAAIGRLSVGVTCLLFFTFLRLDI